MNGHQVESQQRAICLAFARQKQQGNLDLQRALFASVDELPTQTPRFDTKDILHLLFTHLTKLTDILELALHVLDILRRDPRKTPQQLFARCIHALAVSEVFCPNSYGSRKVRLTAVSFQIIEYVCGCIR